MKVVGIGGGHGLATTLRAAKLFSDSVSGVVSVADDGGSSGRLTAELGMPPPGDIRNCLVALSDGGALPEMFQHRFSRGTLEGHPIGNLVIAALVEMRGDFAAAVEEAGRMIGARGSVFPATTELVKLSALVDGGVVDGQVAVAQTSREIASVHLTPPDPDAHEGAVKAILGADQVILGPGSLYTSVIATLLVPGIANALQETKAQRVFVCNVKLQPGETENLDVEAHVEALLAHLGERSIDVVVVQDPPLADGVGRRAGEWPWPEISLVLADVADPSGTHIPEKLSGVLAGL